MASGKKGTDPTRAERKAKKRKLEDAIPNIPGDNESEAVTTSEEPAKKRKRDSDDGDNEENGLKKEKRSKKEKKEKKDKKEKKSNGEAEPALEAENADEASAEKKSDTAVVQGDEIPKKSKKERKAERKALEAAEAAANKDADGPAAPSSTAPKSNGAPVEADTKDKKPKKEKQKGDKKVMSANATEKKDPANPTAEKSGKAARFIVFIGSLPYTATTASIQKHFASVKPTSVRNPMQKEDNRKSKGYAFLEFDGYDHMKTCLKLFHHSMFDDGISPPRKISVELTAGGGGNTKDRKDKIKAKNDKLNEERHRRIHEEAKAKAEKRDGVVVDESNIHPSRRTMVPGNK